MGVDKTLQLVHFEMGKIYALHQSSTCTSILIHDGLDISDDSSKMVQLRFQACKLTLRLDEVLMLLIPTAQAPRTARTPAVTDKGYAIEI